MTRSNYILISVLLITLWLTWTSYKQEKSIEVSLPTRELPLNSIVNASGLAASITPLTLGERKIVPSLTNLFEPPVVLPQVEHKAKFKALPPVAPALPFAYLGRIQTRAGNDVMLDVRGEVTHIQQGDILLGQYKVQAINENVAGLQLQFLYLPLNQIQTLNAQITN